MSSTLKEWLVKTIMELEEERDAVPGAVNEDAAMALAAMKLALASLMADPVAWTDEQELRDVEKYGCGYLFTANPITPNADPHRVIKLYTASPAPMLPEEMPKGLAGQIVSLLAHNIGDKLLAQKIWNACRAAMLQGADGNSPVIPDGWVLVPIEPTYQMCEAMGLPWESPRFPDRYKAMIAAAPQQEVK
ncbi:hypothetical protein [Enterobacter hormaechei]|uniref:hypothetical protein n=1 Tax=Enterobacter hormaechei TaxID=158836 RepID=UPI003EB73E48